MFLRLLFIFFLIQPIFSLNIAVYLSLVGKSHLSFVSSLIDLLVERGHNVVSSFQEGIQELL